jgi:HK97 family phage major capsid protein
MEKENDNNDPLANKIIASINEQKAAVDALEKSVGDLKEVRKELEDVKKAVDGFEGLTSDVKAWTEKMAKYEAKMANLRREVSGDPLKRLTSDEEMAAIITAPARAAYMRHHNKAIPKEIIEAAQRMDDIITGKALTGGATPGSIVMSQDLVTSIYQLVASYGRWSGFDVIRVGQRTVKVPVDTTDPTAIWATEGSAPSEGSYAGSQVTMDIKKILTWIGVSNDLLEDDLVGLAGHIATKFARANAKKLDHACFAADGTDDATHGNFEGIFYFGTAYDLPATIDTVAELTLAHFTGLVAGALDALIESPTTRWWMHPAMLVNVLNVKDSNGRPIFLTALEAPAAGGIGTILGYPVITTNLAPSTVAAEAEFAAFGDANGLAVGIRSDFEMATSVDAKFTEDQTVFRGRMRAGVKIKQATAFEVMTFGTTT